MADKHMVYAYVDDEVWTFIEAQRGKQSRSSYLRDVIDEHKKRTEKKAKK